ncbi:XtrA/YqaO family protein [Niallia sp. Man26]|uniref:XtrA/YqaO family protein n=1 Tax=Niallia sp. Man26 TaxID=2912824 RepID=UPI001EDA3A5D|nr:XtrA/YqaO family protein [Niallia sp. Man26]UPO88319.1 XtrA/YqaO family protein [Niallia sp. Man26]
MRLNPLKIDASKNILEIDIMEQKGMCVIIISDGKAKLAELPIHGETKIITHQGKVKRVRFDEGEDF